MTQTRTLKIIDRSSTVRILYDKVKRSVSMYSLLFESLAYAQSGQASQPSMWEFLILPVSFFLIFYLFLIRPQQRKQKDHEDLLKNLKTGDEVVTSGGIIAKVKSVSEGFVTIDPLSCSFPVSSVSFKASLVLVVIGIDKI